MSEMCKAITLKVKVPPPITLNVNFKGEFLSSSDGEDYKRGYEEGHAQGLIDGRADGYESGYQEGHKVGSETGYQTGKNEGLTEGYDNGYKQGKADGYKDGYEKGYEQGYDKGLADGEKEEQEKSITITKNGTFPVIPDENKVLSKVSVEVDVKSDVVDYMPYVSSVTFPNVLSKITDDIYLDLPNATNINSLFRYASQINCEKITVKVSNKCTDAQWAFSGNNLAADNLKTIELLGDTSAVKTFSNTFRNRKNLESIIGDFDCSSVTNFDAMFVNVYTIKEFFPKAGTIKVSINFTSSADLTDESIDAIVNGYADMTGQTAPVLTVHPKVKAKIVADDLKKDTNPTKRYWLRTLTSKNVTLA